MASSLAAMPHDSAPWRDPSTTRPRRGFFNVLIPPHRPSFVSDAAPAAAAPAPPAEPTPRRSRRVILERWAAAAAAATDSDARRRRDREAELSALASATRPVAARAAVFREPSPAPSDASSTATAAAGPDLPPSGPRASSLIQRWREIEAVGPVTPRASGDIASESDGSPRGRVGCIVKKLSGTASLPEEDLDAANNELSLSQSAPSSPASALRNAVESLAVRIKGPRPPKLVVRTVRGRRAMEELVARMAHRRRRELAALAERHAVSRFGHKGRIQSMLRLNLLHQGDTINDEVWNVLRPVRPHPPKCGPEALRDDSSKTDLQDANECSLQNNRADEQHSDDRNPSVEKLTGLSIESLVNSDGSGNRQYGENIDTKRNQCQEDRLNLVNSCVQSQECSKASSFARYDDHRAVYDNQYVDDISPSTISTSCELQDTPSSRGETLREDNQSLNGSWDERALWMSNLGWPAPVDSMSPDSWHQDTMGDMENHNQIEFNDRPWIDSPNSWRSLHIATQADCRDLSGNADICNLLESKKVSKSLESDFSNKMNHLLRAILQKQRQHHMIDEFGGYYPEHLYWQQNNDGSQNEDQVASAPCSLPPVSHVTAHHQESWQHSSFEHQHHENQILLEMEVRVRSEMAQIHHEIYELRKLAESCIASQVKMQHSIKEEVCSALREAGLMSRQPDITAKKGTCCICHEMQVDSLLYRCGHMCTCFNCADQLKSSSGNCPICQSPIDDVVRAHPNF